MGRGAYWRAERDALEADGKAKWRGPVLVFCEPYKKKGGTWYHVRLWRGKAGKPFANYIFPNHERANAYIAEQVEAERQAIEDKATRKAEVDAKVVEMRKQLIVGTILCNSWGYDQTNVDYYEIVGRTKATVELRKIASKTVDGSEGFMCCRVSPCPGEYVNDKVFTKKITAWGVSFRHGSCSIADANDESYCSWYA